MNHSDLRLKFDASSFIRLSIIIILIVWGYAILRPFIMVLTGGAVFAIALFPWYEMLTKNLTRGKGIMAFLLLLPLLGLILIPGWYLAESILQAVNVYSIKMANGEIIIPKPGNIQDWPISLQPLYHFWDSASGNLNTFYQNYKETLNEAGGWILHLLQDAGSGMLELIISIIISGFMLFYHKSFLLPAQSLIRKIGGNNYNHYIILTALTVRNVMSGVIGVAILQAFMCGVAFFIIDLPYAGLWSMVCLILAIAQIGLWPVFIISSLHAFLHLQGISAIIFPSWILIATLTEQFIKPIIMGRNLPVPMFILFIGSIGGLLAMGFTGLFLGPVVFTLLWQIITDWLNESV